MDLLDTLWGNEIHSVALVQGDRRQEVGKKSIQIGHWWWISSWMNQLQQKYYHLTISGYLRAFQKDLENLLVLVLSLPGINYIFWWKCRNRYSRKMYLRISRLWMGNYIPWSWNVISFSIWNWVVRKAECHVNRIVA